MEYRAAAFDLDGGIREHSHGISAWE
ncbi:hypothetical protein [Bordetella sp. FB-8]